MLASITETVSGHLKFYYEYTLESWNELTPAGYAGVLIFIAVAGWLLMKSSTK